MWWGTWDVCQVHGSGISVDGNRLSTHLPLLCRESSSGKNFGLKKNLWLFKWEPRNNKLNKLSTERKIIYQGDWSSNPISMEYVAPTLQIISCIKGKISPGLLYYSPGLGIITLFWSVLINHLWRLFQNRERISSTTPANKCNGHFIRYNYTV